MQSKGIMHRKKAVVEQGYYNKSKLEISSNMYEIVDLKMNNNDKQREEKLSRRLQAKNNKHERKVLINWGQDCSGEERDGRLLQDTDDHRQEHPTVQKANKRRNQQTGGSKNIRSKPKNPNKSRDFNSSDHDERSRLNVTISDECDNMYSFEASSTTNINNRLQSSAERRKSSGVKRQYTSAEEALFSNNMGGLKARAETNTHAPMDEGDEELDPDHRKINEFIRMLENKDSGMADSDNFKSIDFDLRINDEADDHADEIEAWRHPNKEIVVHHDAYLHNPDEAYPAHQINSNHPAILAGQVARENGHDNLNIKTEHLPK